MELSIYIYIILLLLCLLIGFFGGLLGIALGAVRLPIIIFLGVDPIIAASTNLLAVIFGSFAGLIPAIKQSTYKIFFKYSFSIHASSFFRGIFCI
jgi:uncharacterized membrane protein YfcA